jgi:hypothetical protein
MNKSEKKLKSISYFLLGITALIITIIMIMDLIINDISMEQNLLSYLVVYAPLIPAYLIIKNDRKT